MGCFRSREERLHWTKLDQDIQSQIIKACGIRKKRAERGKWAKKAVSGDDAQIDLLAQHKP
jgi:predicted Fe-S protein YdhL (DUF1289 family)